MTKITLTKADTANPAFSIISPTSIIVPTGLKVDAGSWGATIEDAHIELSNPQPGQDFALVVDTGGKVAAVPFDDADPDYTIGGFHFAPGGNAQARAGGDSIPQINPFSIWDTNFRPACENPRGMTLVDGRFWADIYLLGFDHRKGTSIFGNEIADGWSPPYKVNGKSRYDRYGFDWYAANDIYAHHGKTLLSVVDFFDAAFGVTERTSARRDPEVTGLDAPRTSKWGLMQATGSMWTWGNDGDPDEPRPYYFGGNWDDDASSGSRTSAWSASPTISHDHLGARGRSDHLNLDHPAR